MSLPGQSRWLWLPVVACVILHRPIVRAQAPSSPSESVDFLRDIQPIFQSCCYDCHGPDKQKHGFRLDQKAAALRGGDSGPVILPGKAAQSRLYQLVAGLNRDTIMPPKGDRLRAEQLASIRAWIDQGAAWPDALGTEQKVSPSLWSLKPLQAPTVPSIKRSNWARNPIDQFVAAELEKKGLTPSSEADRVTLIRRLTYDLNGLPPTPEEIDAFVRDNRSDAYERLVDRLLAATQYGERWGRHWLDVVRYTESQGFEYDRMRENAWRYRDYVIASFNEDKPYDRFVVEQLAGDVLEPISTSGMVATGFLVCGAWDQAGSSQANLTQRRMTREEELEDMIAAVAQTFLGLTVNCARCHSHKFDPIPQADYYRFKSVFEGVRHGEQPVLPPQQLRRREEKLTSLRELLAVHETGLAAIESSCAPSSVDAICERQERIAALHQAHAEIGALPPVPLAYIGVREQPEPTHRLKRGDVRSPEEVVTPGGLSALTDVSSELGLAADAPEGERRRHFAEWVIDRRNPLPARVIVNRLWQYHFGQGIVGTPNDFGASGAKPTHPELLDWLAGELLDHRWTLKAVQRLIVCSAAYRQSSSYRSEAASLDADNLYLWRFAPHRLEAEAARDAMLFVSGQLNGVVAGPSFRPFDTSDFNATFYYPKDKQGREFDRRTVYRMNVNSGKDPMLETLDCPDPSVKTPRRGVTTTPLQALSLMNSSFVQRQAGCLAERVQARAQNDRRAAVTWAYRYCFGRDPSVVELRRAEEVLQSAGLNTVCWALLNATEFFYVR